MNEIKEEIVYENEDIEIKVITEKVVFDEYITNFTPEPYRIITDFKPKLEIKFKKKNCLVNAIVNMIEAK